ncbi:hypothetical protein K449DRAFT_449793 [Hypoxylon sp. EC38]|nr:hypothetical protein K449DRAFT_449793 [Hypoxylon sp. EC38]
MLKFASPSTNPNSHSIIIFIFCGDISKTVLLLFILFLILSISILSLEVLTVEPL